MVQWLGLCAVTAKGLLLIPGQGAKMPRVVQPGIYIYIYIYIHTHIHTHTHTHTHNMVIILNIQRLNNVQYSHRNVQVHC